MYERDGSHYSANPSEAGTASSLESLLEEKVATLRALVAGVTADLDDRTRASTRIRAEIQDHYRCVKTKLLGLTV